MSSVFAFLWSQLSKFFQLCWRATRNFIVSKLFHQCLSTDWIHFVSCLAYYIINKDCFVDAWHTFTVVDHFIINVPSDTCIVFEVSNWLLCSGLSCFRHVTNNLIFWNLLFFRNLLFFSWRVRNDNTLISSYHRHSAQCWRIRSISKLVADVAIFAGRECFISNNFLCSLLALLPKTIQNAGIIKSHILACSIEKIAKYTKNRSNQCFEKTASL